MTPTMDGNPNLLWSTTVMDALARVGLQDVVIAPGSRSTPLALACAAHPSLRVFAARDERGAGFFALGLARERNRPVALISTSGTATVNFHPAAVEARMSHVPLLLLTADRPPELRHSGANQTIDQVKQFGDHVLWAVDMPLPERDPADVVLRNVRGLAARAYATANGIVRGPVHLNFPFRKPLEPVSDRARRSLAGRIGERFNLAGAAVQRVPAQAPETQLLRGILEPTAEQVGGVAALLRAHPHGLILCGPDAPGEAFPELVARLARRLGYPLVADPLSHVRFGPAADVATHLAGYETVLAQKRSPGWAPPTLILRFGAVPTSKWLNAYLDALPDAQRIHVRASGVWADDTHRVNLLLQADEAALCRGLLEVLGDGPAPENEWMGQIRETEQRAWRAINAGLRAHWFDAAAVATLFQELPDPATVVVGNSLPIRHVDQFVPPSSERIAVHGNRGASGIDGMISTALGVAAGTTTPVYLLIGDVSFLHDLNALLAGTEYDLAPLTVILLNNDGGGIFRRLPVAAVEPPFAELFLTPHGVDFGPLVRALGWEYARADDRRAFRDALDARRGAAAPGVIEVRTDGERDERLRRELVARVQAGLPGKDESTA